MLLSIEQVTKKINDDETLMVAGDQSILSKLPKGNWIGGSIPYFISENGGVFSKEVLFVTNLDKNLLKNPRIMTYDTTTIPKISKDASENGITFLILPASSAVHIEYAKNSPEYEQMFMHPIAGWISGVAMDEIGKVKATVINGMTGEVYTDRAIAIHFDVPAGKFAKIGIINIFSQGQGDTLEFEEEGFDIKYCLVNGVKKSFAQYITDSKTDTQLPMVANFSGAMVNVSFQSIDLKTDMVHLFAPVFKNTVYKIAAPVGDYAKAFEAALKNLGNKQVIFSCNCILNYLYGELNGKKTGNATGPVTFGEIAYQLLNQTLVYVEI